MPLVSSNGSAASRHPNTFGPAARTALAQAPDGKAALDRLCELNVIEQVLNVCETTVVRDAWDRGQRLTVHGWIYGLNDGLLREVGMCVRDRKELRACMQAALAAIQD